MGFKSIFCLYLDVEIPDGGLKTHDLIEWSGIANRVKRPCVLILRASAKTPYGPPYETFSLLRLTMMAAKHQVSGKVLTKGKLRLVIPQVCRCCAGYKFSTN